MSKVRINRRLQIPEGELRFTASRGGGPGGQHVNKVASRVTLSFDVDNSPSLDESDRERIRRKLANRISNEGVLSLSSHSSRSQAANRAELVDRFAGLIAEALRRSRPRRKTRPSRASRRRRLDSKRKRGDVKRGRAKIRGDSDN